MKENKMLIFSLVLIFGGILGGGLFAIANSLERIAYEVSDSMRASNATCGIILFILLALAVVGIILFVIEVFGHKNEK